MLHVGVYPLPGVVLTYVVWGDDQPEVMRIDSVSEDR